MSTTTEKIKLADAVLKARSLMTEKHELLLRAADAWEEKSRDWALQKGLRENYVDRARAARSEAAELARELGI